ncbi:MAG: hypothetical protein K2G10_00575, partial [Alistipes sp.]|nr:hypothetical protein [Alistipes sp.]
MKRFATIALAAAVVTAFASCGKDKEPGRITFERSALYLAPGESAAVGFSLDNIKPGTLALSSKPEGWELVSLDAAARTLTVMAPDASASEAAASGSVVLRGISAGDASSATATLFVGVVPSVDLSDRPANSYLANRPATHYLFDASHKGDGVSALATERVEVIWQSASGLVEHLQ